MRCLSANSSTVGLTTVHRQFCVRRAGKMNNAFLARKFHIHDEESTWSYFLLRIFVFGSVHHLRLVHLRHRSLGLHSSVALRHELVGCQVAIPSCLAGLAPQMFLKRILSNLCLGLGKIETPNRVASLPRYQGRESCLWSPGFHSFASRSCTSQLAARTSF